MLRITVSVGLLALLVSKIDFEDLVPSGRALAGTVAFLVAGIGLMALTIVIGAWRWQLVLEAFDSDVPIRRLIGHNFAGQFVGNVLPSTIGGDVVRVARSTKDVGGRDTAFASVVIDRLTGFVSLPVLHHAIGFLARPSLVGETNAWYALLCCGGTIVVFGMILVVAGHPSLGGRFKGHTNWMRYLGVIHIGVDRLRRRPPLAAATLAVAVGYQMVYTAAVFSAVHTVGLATIPDSGSRRVRARRRDGPGAAHLDRRLRPAGGDAGPAVASARRDDRPGPRGGAGLVSDGPHRQPGRGAADALGDRRPVPAGGAPSTITPPASSHPDHSVPARTRALHRRLPAARVLRNGAVVYWWAEVAFVAVYYAVYSAIRNLNEGGAGIARHHALEIIGFQRDIGINVEHQLQQWALGFRPLIIASNYFYGSLHFVVTAGSSSTCITGGGTTIRCGATRCAIATGLALIGFIFFPLMPPACCRPTTASWTPGEVPDVLVVQLGGGGRNCRTSSRRCRACTAPGRCSARVRSCPACGTAGRRCWPPATRRSR